MPLYRPKTAKFACHYEEAGFRPFRCWSSPAAGLKLDNCGLGPPPSNRRWRSLTQQS